MNYLPFEFLSREGHCPNCGVYSSFKWGDNCSVSYTESNFSKTVSSLVFSFCAHCFEYTIWKRDEEDYLSARMIFPITGSAPLPNQDLPKDIQDDYLEARSIVELSPRGAVALLRLAIQKICKHLGESGENINKDIKALVSRGLNPTIQRALDSIRVTGNHAVHPGVLDLKDDRETAIKLFGFINVIADVMITQPKMINEFYELKIPEKDKLAIKKRDGN